MTRPVRILMVEDNPGDVELTREALESGKLALDLVVATNGAEALRMLRDGAGGSPPRTPDLVLLDLNLPGVGGRDVLAGIREHQALRHIPVVILTSSDAESDILRTYELGANCFVKKPVGLEAFERIVRNIQSFWFTVVRLPGQR